MNEYIGFDVSVDSYLENGAERHDYVNWNGEGKYWQKPSALGQVELVDIGETNGSPAKEEIQPPEVNDSLDEEIDQNEGMQSGGEGLWNRLKIRR